MRLSTLINLTLVAITSLTLFACGGGGGGGGGGAAATPALTADKMTAVSPVLIGGTTTITFNFGAAYNGQPVTFTVSPASAALTNMSTVVTAGIATVTVTNPTQANVTVTANIPGYTGSKIIQFIPQPDKVVVHVALSKTVTDLYNLTFGLRNNNSLGWTYSTDAPAPGYTGFVFPNGIFFIAGNDVYHWDITTFGFNITPSVNIREVTFIPGASAGIPFFEIFQYLNNPQDLSYQKYLKTTNDPSTDTPSPVTPLTATDFVITTDYYLGTALLATN